MQDFINKFELSNFLKEIKLATNNHKNILAFFSNLLFVNSIVFIIKYYFNNQRFETERYAQV